MSAHHLGGPDDDRVRYIDPLADPTWSKLHGGQASLFASDAWLRAVAQTYDLKPVAAVAVDDSGNPAGGISYCVVDDGLGERMVSFPFSDFHDPVGDPAAAAVAINSLASGELPLRLKIPAGSMPDLDLDKFPNQRRDLLHHVIEVTDEDPDTQFANLHSQVRQNIRKGRRAGIEVEMRSDLDAVRQFFDLHVGVRTRKYRLLPQPYRFFEAIHESFSDQDRIRVALAKLEGRVVAGIVYLECGDTLYYKFNASDAGELKVRPNELLIWAGIEHCISRGLHGIDLGVSDVDQPGLVRYKRKFAQREQEVVTLDRPPAGEPDARVADLRASFGRLTELLTDERVPASIAEEAGAVLYRYFT